MNAFFLRIETRGYCWLWKKTAAILIAMMLFTLAGIPALACRSKSTSSPDTPKNDMTPMTVSLEKLKGKSLLLFHHSVGGNILLGIRELLQSGKIAAPIRIVEIDSAWNGSCADLRVVDFFTIISISVGSNRYPLGKIAGMEKILTGALKECPIEYVMSKLCYVDFEKTTDYSAVLQAYISTVDTLQQGHHQMTFLHCTTPLKRSGGTGLAGILKKEWPNRVREAYNTELIRHYGKSAPVFDLAGSETGSSATSTGKRSLLPAYTDDGGHLNRTGREAVARDFLTFLETL